MGRAPAVHKFGTADVPGLERKIHRFAHKLRRRAARSLNPVDERRLPPGADTRTRCDLGRAEKADNAGVQLTRRPAAGASAAVGIPPVLAARASAAASAVLGADGAARNGWRRPVSRRAA